MDVDGAETHRFGPSLLHRKASFTECPTDNEGK